MAYECAATHSWFPQIYRRPYNINAGAKDGIITPTITIEFFKTHLLQKIGKIYKIDIQIPDPPH